VEDGDEIVIDLYEKRLDLSVDAETLEKRRRAWKPPARSLTGVLARYVQTVEQANLGAVQR
jgi:dihydroxy-acid dehydratase